jgi:hypothetical protein
MPALKSVYNCKSGAAGTHEKMKIKERRTKRYKTRIMLKE